MATDFEAIVRRYQELPQNHGETLDDVRAFLESNESQEPRISRQNFDGHFTASGLFVDAVKRRILLFRHPVHQEILQPGGHFQSNDESPLEVATRKVLQETPYEKEDIRYLPFDYDFLVPIDIDSHAITKPEDERDHIHYDLRFVFLAVAGEGENREFQANPAADDAKPAYTYRWFDLAELSELLTFSRLRKKLHEFLSVDSARRRFFVGLTQEFPIKAEPTKTIIVTHVLPDAVEFLDALQRQTNLVAVIPKPKSKDVATCERLRGMGIPVREDLEREQIAAAIPSILEDAGDGNAVLLDIGGWFVPILDSLPDPDRVRILGIVEDTKNGEKKYRDYAQASPLPVDVVSVAESTLKANEDHLVGKSIVFSADAVLRGCGLVLDHMECGVIGYGKIGRSIAQHLLSRGIKPYVVETNPLRNVTAFREGCTVRHRDWANRNVDVIFCSTGNQATGIEDFRSLRSGAFIFSVTSSDDEFDRELLPKEYHDAEEEPWPHVKRYDGPQNHFYFVNDGNAVNFLHDAVLWEFIQLVKGGIYLAMKNLIEETPMPTLRQNPAAIGPGAEKMFGLREEDQKQIAKLWLETVLLGIKLEE